MINGLSKRTKALGPLFWICVAAPTLLAIIYFGVIASDVYISESRFVIRSPEKQTSSALGMLLRSPGVSASGDEVFAVQEYVESRDALKALDQKGIVSRAFSRPGVDWFSRLNQGRHSFEDLYKYYKKKVDIKHEASSSITTMQFRAYSASDAYHMNERLLELSEGLVNRLNGRSREDLIRYATNEVRNAEAAAQTAAIALSAFRNQQGIVDPDRQATVQIQLVSKLQDELITAKTQLLQLRAFTPDNPQIPVLQTSIIGLTKEIDEQVARVAGGQKSLAAAQVRYQRLSLESQFADKQLASALASLEEARNEARRKQVYLERIVQPNIPDEALEPRRWRGIFSTFALGMVAWGVLSMLLAGLKEHRD